MGATPNRGYVYPASTDNTQVWTHLQTLADDIDADVETLDNESGVWTSYSPLLYQGMNTTKASIARTVSLAKYIKRGKLCIVHHEIIAGATSTNGMGVQLPFTGAARWLGNGYGGVFGTSPPAGQVGITSMSVGLTELIVTGYTNGYNDIISGQTFRGTMIYETA